MKKLCVLAVMLLVSVTAAGNAGEFKSVVKSGLQPGAFPDAFIVQDCTGPKKGTSLCYRCRYGGRPVVAIFTHRIDGKVVDLIKKIDAKVGKNRDRKMAAFVVLLTDDPDKAEPKLVQLAKKHDIRHVPLTIFDGPDGPEAYKLSRKADVTVLMWVQQEVKSNYAFTKGRLDDKSVKQILSGTSTILK